MRKSTLLLAVVLLLGGGTVFVLGRMGQLPSSVARVMGGDGAALMAIATSFLEDIKFKDFKKAASYHEEALRNSVDIPFLLWRVFAVKPEFLEMLEYEVLYADVDSSNLRARVKTRTKVNVLNKDEVKTAELMLYFYRETPQSPWFMKLEDSLRSLPAEAGKAH